MSCELQIRTADELPTTFEDVTKFAILSAEKLKSVRAEISAVKRLGLAREVLEQKVAEAQKIAELKTYAEMRIGELTAAMPTAHGRRTDLTSSVRTEEVEQDVVNSTVHAVELSDQYTGASAVRAAKAKQDEESRNSVQTETLQMHTKAEALERTGIKRQAASEFERMNQHRDIVEKVLAEKREAGDIASRSDILKAIRTEEKKTEIEQAKADIAKQAETKSNKPVITIGNGIGFVPNTDYDLLLTDPPYSTDVDDIEAFVDSWLYHALNHVKPTGFAYVFIGAYPNELRAYLNAKLPEHIRLEQQLIWTYKNTLGNNPKDRYKQNYQVCLFYRGVDAPALDCPLTNEQWAVQEINAPDGRQGDQYHAWQKPMEIAERFIRHSTKAGMTVFDPFACTGTFLLAASKLGRIGYGFEINPQNADIAKERGCDVREL